MAEQGRRTGFAPTVGLGLAAAALTSVAAAKPWFRLGSDRPTTLVVPPGGTTIDMPLALALSLVVLGGWGVVLVSRGVLRRVLAAVALTAALGVVACAASAPFVLPHDLRDRLGPSADGLGAEPTGWFLTAAVASVLSALALAAAWRLSPRWPSMSSRYDAPSGRPSGQPVAADPTDHKDLWKALDEGLDPTDPGGSPSP